MNKRNRPCLKTHKLINIFDTEVNIVVRSNTATATCQQGGLEEQSGARKCLCACHDVTCSRRSSGWQHHFAQTSFPQTSLAIPEIRIRLTWMPCSAALKPSPIVNHSQMQIDWYACRHCRLISALRVLSRRTFLICFGVLVALHLVMIFLFATFCHPNSLRFFLSSKLSSLLLVTCQVLLGGFFAADITPHGVSALPLSQSHWVFIPLDGTEFVLIPLNGIKWICLWLLLVFGSDQGS